MAKSVTGLDRLLRGSASTASVTAGDAAGAPSIGTGVDDAVSALARLVEATVGQAGRAADASSATAPAEMPSSAVTAQPVSNLSDVSTVADLATTSADAVGPVALSLADATAVATSAIKSGTLKGFDLNLAALYFQAGGEAGRMAAFTAGVEHFDRSLSADGKYVLIDTVAGDRNGAALLASLKAIGLKGGSSFGAVASGWMPVAGLGALAATANLVSARESAMRTSAGSVTTQADAAMRADDARAEFAVNGSGLRVGVLSDSMNRNGSTTDNLFTNITSDDLPFDTRILSDLQGVGAGSDEGRAMAQLIHDLAPGAAIDFASAFNGLASFANNILALAAAGDRVIVDDVTYFSELQFQNGIVAQAVNQVAAQGVSYFTSAGNDGIEGYQGNWVSGATQTLNGSAYTLMQFAPGQDYLNVTLGGASGSARGIFILQWDNPGASAGGVGATSDLDIYLTDANGTTIRAAGVANNLGGDPVEVFAFTGSGTYQLRVGLSGGNAAPGQIRIIASGNGAAVDLENPASNLNQSTLIGHHGAEGAIAVAAASFSQTPEFGVTPPRAEGFTSRGSQTILFDDNGNRLAAAQTYNVAFTAVDGGNTTFFSQDSGQDADTLPNFFGTSAAAPDAAAVAALLLQANPNLGPDDIRALLMSSAIDMDDTATPGVDAGFDSRTGAGLIQALDAVRFAVDRVIRNDGLSALYGTRFGETITGSALANQLFGRGGDDTITGEAGNDTIYGGDGRDTIFGGADDDQLFGDAGDDTLRGGDGADTVAGGTGDDMIEGGLGNDTLNGGTGNNTVDYRNAPSAVSVNLDAGAAAGGDGNDRLYNFQNVVGTAFGDSIVGNGEDNALTGGAGSDELSGGDGNDTLSGGGGAETQFVGTVARPDIVKARSEVIGSFATARVLTDADFDLSFDYEIESSRSIPHATVRATASGGREYYKVTAAAGAQMVFDIDRSDIDTVITLFDANGVQLAQNDDDYADPGSSLYNSRLVYTAATAGDYYIRIEDFNGPTLPAAGETYTLNVSLTSAQPTLTGSTVDGADIIDGGDGIDTATYNGLAAVRVNLGLQGQLQATGGGGSDFLLNIENLVGTGFDDVLIGDGNSNILTGLDGSDQLNGAGGADTLYGGLGDDTYFVDNAGDIVTEYAGEGTDTIVSSVSYNLTGTFVETLTLSGSADINGTGNLQFNTLNGNNGSNVLDGGGGVDRMAGGAGDDTYYVDNSGDVVVELSGRGNDTVFSSANFTLAGTFVETLTLTGSDNLDALGNGQNNVLNGNSGNNVLNGGGGADTMSGGLGNDTYYVDNAGDVVIELSGGGSDTINSAISYNLAGQFVETLKLTGTAAINGTGNSQANTIVGNDAANVLLGNGGVDALIGNGGDDRLEGGAGADLLRGGLGNDDLYGGADADRFQFDTALNATTNLDRIYDFAVGSDLVVLDDAIFAQAGAVGQLSAAAFNLGSSAADDSDRILYDSATGLLRYDPDGTGSLAATAFANIGTGLSLNASSFRVI